MLIRFVIILSILRFYFKIKESIMSTDLIYLQNYLIYLQK